MTLLFDGAAVGIEGAGDSFPCTPSDNSTKYLPSIKCSNAVVIKGTCSEHGNIRYRLAPCGRRSCDHCGPIGRWRIAERIAFGVRQFWPCAWIVLTYGSEDAEKPEFKKQARKDIYCFLRAIKKELGRKRLEYACTYELTKRGRLHINLIVANWQFISKKRLQELWGSNLWVERVKDSERIGREAAKAYSPEGLGGYLSKLEQAVPVEWGRRCSFSKGWPRLPKGGLPRVGEVSWQFGSKEDSIDFHVHDYNGRLIRVEEGEFALHDEDCCCFIKAKDPSPGG